MKRVLVLGAVVGAGLLAITVVGQQAPPTGAAPAGGPPGAPPAAPGGRAGGGGFASADSIEKVADNLYRIPGGGGNSAVWVRADGVLLVDTKLPDNGQKLLDLIRTVSSKPITHIINTHTHNDHTGSNSFFPAQVEVVAQENTKANMEKMASFKTNEGKVGLPDRTYKDKMSLFSGSETVDLYYFGPAHTSGDTFVVFPGVRAMHTGDVFPRKGQPFLDASNGGSGVAYGETIAKAVAGIKNVDIVITGHDDVSKWQDFVDYGEFNRLFLQHARDSLKAGKSAEQAMIDLKLPAKFNDYTLSGGLGGPAGNFTVVYAELQNK